MSTKPISLTQFLIEEQRAPTSMPICACSSKWWPAPVKPSRSPSARARWVACWARPAPATMQGEAQKKLDVLSNEILLEANAWGGHLAAAPRRKWTIRSPFGRLTPRATSCCCLIRSTAAQHRREHPVGTIFSVLRCPDGVTSPGAEHFLQPGHAPGGRRLHV